MVDVVSRIKLLFQTKGAQKATKQTEQVGRATTRLGQASASAGRQFSAQSHGLGGLVTAYAGAAANIFAITMAFNALSKAARAEQTIQGTRALAAQIGESGDEMLAKMQEITRGQLTMATTSESLNIALSAGFSSTQIERLSRVALKASIALGRSLPDALTRLARGTAKIEPEILDELGIFVRLDRAVEKYADSTGKAVSSLTQFERSQAFLNEALEQGEKKYSIIDESSLSAAASFDIMAAKISELGQTLGALLAASLTPVVNFISGNFLNTLATFGLISGLVFSKLGQVVKGSVSGAVIALDRFGESLSARLINQKKLGLKTQDLAKTLNNLDLRTVRGTRSVQQRTKALIELGRKQELTIQQTKELSRALAKQAGTNTLFTVSSAAAKAAVTGFGRAATIAAGAVNILRIGVRGLGIAFNFLFGIIGKVFFIVSLLQLASSAIAKLTGGVDLFKEAGSALESGLKGMSSRMQAAADATNAYNRAVVAAVANTRDLGNIAKAAKGKEVAVETGGSAFLRWFGLGGETTEAIIQLGTYVDAVQNEFVAKILSSREKIKNMMMKNQGASPIGILQELLIGIAPGQEGATIRAEILNTINKITDDAIDARDNALTKLGNGTDKEKSQTREAYQKNWEADILRALTPSISVGMMEEIRKSLNIPEEVLLAAFGENYIEAWQTQLETLASIMRDAIDPQEMIDTLAAIQTETGIAPATLMMVMSPEQLTQGKLEVTEKFETLMTEGLDDVGIDLSNFYQKIQEAVKGVKDLPLDPFTAQDYPHLPALIVMIQNYFRALADGNMTSGESVKQTDALNKKFDITAKRINALLEGGKLVPIDIIQQFVNLKTIIEELVNPANEVIKGFRAMKPILDDMFSSEIKGAQMVGKLININNVMRKKTSTLEGGTIKLVSSAAELRENELDTLDLILKSTKDRKNAEETYNQAMRAVVGSYEKIIIAIDKMEKKLRKQQQQYEFQIELLQKRNKLLEAKNELDTILKNRARIEKSNAREVAFEDAKLKVANAVNKSIIEKSKLTEKNAKIDEAVFKRTQKNLDLQRKITDEITKRESTLFGRKLEYQLARQEAIPFATTDKDRRTIQIRIAKESMDALREIWQRAETSLVDYTRRQNDILRKQTTQILERKDIAQNNLDNEKNINAREREKAENDRDYIKGLREGHASQSSLADDEFNKRREIITLEEKLTKNQAKGRHDTAILTLQQTKIQIDLLAKQANILLEHQEGLAKVLQSHAQVMLETYGSDEQRRTAREVTLKRFGLSERTVGGGAPGAPDVTIVEFARGSEFSKTMEEMNRKVLGAGEKLGAERMGPEGPPSGMFLQLEQIRELEIGGAEEKATHARSQLELDRKARLDELLHKRKMAEQRLLELQEQSNDFDARGEQLTTNSAEAISAAGEVHAQNIANRKAEVLAAKQAYEDALQQHQQLAALNKILNDELVQVVGRLGETFADNFVQGIDDVVIALNEGTLTMDSFKEGFKEWILALLLDLQQTLLEELVYGPIKEAISNGIRDIFTDVIGEKELSEAAASLGGAAVTSGDVQAAGSEVVAATVPVGQLVTQAASQLSTALQGAGSIITSGMGSMALKVEAGAAKLSASFLKTGGTMGLSMIELGTEIVLAAEAFAVQLAAAQTTVAATSSSGGAAGGGGGGGFSDFLFTSSGGSVQRFAAGGGALYRDRIPALLEPGEFVIRKPMAKAIGGPALERMNAHGQMPGGNVEVNLINKGTPQQAEAKEKPKFDGKGMVIEIVLTDLKNNGPIKQAIRGGGRR